MGGQQPEVDQLSGRGQELGFNIILGFGTKKMVSGAFGVGYPCFGASTGDGGLVPTKWHNWWGVLVRLTKGGQDRRMGQLR